MYAVAGVSGRTGAATAEALLKRGQKVRVLVRREEQGEPWLRRHAEVAVVDLGDTGAVTKALTGMQGAWLLLPPLPTAEDLLGESAKVMERLVAGVKASKVKHVCFLSGVGAQHAQGTGPLVALHRAEKALKDAAPQLTLLRAAPFVENWGAFFLEAMDTGELPFFGHAHQKFPQSCARDIGEAAAKALEEPPTGHVPRVIELAGKENWSAEDVAEVTTSLLGTPIKAVSRPIDGAKAAFLARGLPEQRAALEAEWYQALARGLLNFAHPHGYVRGTTGLYEALKPMA